MRESHRCERCGSTYPQAGVLAGRCPRCLAELGLNPPTAFEDEEIVLKALADEARLMVGSRIAHYEVLALLGAGGMGAVWKANDTVLGRAVALKTLPPHFEWDAAGLARLELEAKLLASLNHPNIAAIHGLQDDGGKRFLVLEFVEGETVADCLRRGVIPLQQSLQIARQIADALGAAHEKGIIHRDLKPQNIQITEDGTVKVLDFGLARALPGDTVGSPSGIEATDSKMILGTAAYMAPEQARGRKMDRRADIWAFGVVLYEMLTGTRPFRGADSAETIASILTKEPDFDALPVEVRRLTRKCLEKEPKDRLRDIGDVWGFLDPSPATSASRNRQVERRATLPWIFASAVFGIVSLVLSTLMFRPLPLPDVLRFEIHAPPGSRLPLGTPAISDDGPTLAYVVIDSDRKTSLYVRPVNRDEIKVLRGTEAAVHPFWSPDQRSLAVSVGFALKEMSLATGSTRELMSETSGRWQGAWSVNGTILARAGRGLVRISTPGVAPEPIPDSVGMSFPAFLSDGRRFLARFHSDKEDSIQLVSLDSMKRTLVIGNVVSAPVLAPTPRGKAYLFFLSGSDLMAQEFDEASGKALGTAIPYITGVGRVGNPAVMPALAVSPGGHLAYQSSDIATVRHLRWVDRQGQTLRTLSPDVSVGNPRLSPNEKLVAGLRNRDVWMTDLLRESSDRKTFEGPVGNNVVWSKDNSQLAFRTQNGIYAVNVNGGNPRLLTKTAGMPTSWSNEYLVYTFPPTLEEGKTYLLNLANPGKPTEAGSFQGSSFAGEISPDGKYIAFGSKKSGRYEIYLQRIPRGGEIRVSIDGGGMARWRSDGKELFFISMEGDLMAVDIQLEDTPSVGHPRKLFTLGSRDAFEAANSGYDVSRDGQRFLIPSAIEELDAPINVVLNWWVELEKKPER